MHKIKMHSLIIYHKSNIHVTTTQKSSKNRALLPSLNAVWRFHVVCILSWLASFNIMFVRFFHAVYNYSSCIFVAK